MPCAKWEVERSLVSRRLPTVPSESGWPLSKRRDMTLGLGRMWLTVNAAYGVAGDQELLVGWDHVGMEPGVPAAYLSLSPDHFLVLHLVQLYAGPFQTFANATPDVG